MAYEKKDGDIILFRNNKRDKDTQPVMRGELLLGGTTYEVALWGKPDRNGEPFWVGNAKPKQARTAKPAAKSNLTEADVTDSDIPF